MSFILEVRNISVEFTATQSLIHCIMHPPARFVELLLTHDPSGSRQSFM